MEFQYLTLSLYYFNFIESKNHPSKNSVGLYDDIGKSDKKVEKRHNVGDACEEAGSKKSKLDVDTCSQFTAYIF